MDIRLKELEMLTKIDQTGQLTLWPLNGPDKDLAAFLVSNGYVNDLTIPWVHNESLLRGIPGESEFERRLHNEKITTLSKVIGGGNVSLTITHAGRVRIAELRQTLRSGKLREQNEILWDGRHFNMDLRIALLDASASNQVAIAYLDLNGFKAVNDSMGHDAGDVAIQAYFHDVNDALTDHGDAYRLGGDEVGVIVPACSLDEATKIIRRVCLLLQQEHLQFENKELPPVSIAAGVSVSTAPIEDTQHIRKLSESAMYKAKKFTERRAPRESSWNIVGEDKVYLL